eukprot:5587863-Alexandrium_andersonii.AAC.1
MRRAGLRDGVAGIGAPAEASRPAAKADPGARCVGWRRARPARRAPAECANPASVAPGGRGLC